MLFCDFQNKLRRLNPKLYIDANHEATAYGQDWPVAGLYLEGRFIMGVPKGEVPEYTLLGVDFYTMALRGQIGLINRIKDTGYIADGVDFRVLKKGYLQMLTFLIRSGFIDLEKTNKLFRCHINPKSPRLPSNSIQYNLNR